MSNKQNAQITQFFQSGQFVLHKTNSIQLYTCITVYYKFYAHTFNFQVDLTNWVNSLWIEDMLSQMRFVSTPIIAKIAFKDVASVLLNLVLLQLAGV